MHLKIPSDESHDRGQEKSTSSIYISQQAISVSNSTSDHAQHNANSAQSNVADANVEQKPVLTIQVNQNSNQQINQNASNLVNIVSCFRAYPTVATAANANHGIENLVHSINPQFSVSVNRNNCNYGGYKADESVNNENNQNIVNVDSSTRNHFSKASIKREDLNEISVDQILISDSTVITANTNHVDYQNMELDSVTNHRDQVGLIGSEKIVISTATSGTSGDIISSQQQQSTTESVDNRISAATIEVENDAAVAVDNNFVMETNDNCAKSESQTFREQRRRERRERRQARQRAQHGHHHVNAAPVHQRLAGNSRTVNGAEPSRAYEILPDLINNHLPPPYTSLPLHMSSAAATTPPQIHPAIISPAPVVGDDCRFSFPIPIIRRSPSEHSGRKGCCGNFFQSPKSLGLIAMIALGGVACALGGAALGASGLAGPPSTHLTVSLLMIGIGVVLVTISGVAWRVTTADNATCLGMEGTEFEHCGRQQCMRNSSMSHGLLYPEFQHRAPPPSYQASMQEYRLRLLLLDRDRQSHGRRLAAAAAAASAQQQQQSSSPPPTYRSNIGTQLRSHRMSVLSHVNETNSILFGGLSRIINGNLAPSSQMNAVPSSDASNLNSSSSINQFSSPLTPTETQLQTQHQQNHSSLSTTSTTLISQQCQPKNRLLINQNNDDGDNVSKETNLHQMKVNQKISSITEPNQLMAIVETNGRQFEKSNESLCDDSNGMVTIVTISNSDISNNTSQ